MEVNLFIKTSLYQLVLKGSQGLSDLCLEDLFWTRQRSTTFPSKCLQFLAIKFSTSLHNLFKEEPITLMGSILHDLKGRPLKTFIRSVVRDFM